MAWKLTQFDGYRIPEGLPELPVGGGPSLNASISLPHGQFFDAYQSDILPIAFPYDLQYRAIVTESMSILSTGGTPTLITNLNYLKSRRGRRGLLVREMDDGTIHWCYARLKQVSSTRLVENMSNHLMLDMQFEIQSLWFGISHGGGVLDGGTYLDAGVTLDGTVVYGNAEPGDTYVLSNSGNAATNNLIITINTGETEGVDSDTTNFTFNVPGQSYFTWSGTLNYLFPNPNALVIDCSARSVTQNGVGVYSDFALSSTGHHINDWIRLNPGDTNLIIGWETTEPLALMRVTFEYYDAWE